MLCCLICKEGKTIRGNWRIETWLLSFCLLENYQFSIIFVSRKCTGAFSVLARFFRQEGGTGQKKGRLELNKLF